MSVNMIAANLRSPGTDEPSPDMGGYYRLTQILRNKREQESVEKARTTTIFNLPYNREIKGKRFAKRSQFCVDIGDVSGYHKSSRNTLRRHG
jgi:hypothetical protein